VTDKAQRTIHIKWVRSGIAFTYHQKGMVRSLGLRRLNQIVERPDTAQIRGLVASIPHLVEIVGGPVKLAPWAAIPEYTLHPPVVVAPEPPAAEAAAIAQPQAPAAAEEVAAKSAEAKKAKTHAPEKAKKAAKPAKAAEAKSKAGKDDGKKKAKAVAGKSAKPAKAKKK